MKESKKFTRKIEDFTCFNCGILVHGTGFTNHCPNCLWSEHTDINPGDRQCTCHGPMQPLRTEILHDRFVIIHKCLKCGIEKRIKAEESDNKELLIRLLSKLK